MFLVVISPPVHIELSTERRLTHLPRSHSTTSAYYLQHLSHCFGIALRAVVWILTADILSEYTGGKNHLG